VFDEPIRSDAPGDVTGAAGDSVADAQLRRPGSHRKTKPDRPQRPFWVEAVVLLVFAMGIALVVHQFFFQAFYIPSGSMENTLHVGDRVLVNRMSYKVGQVQRGQVIVFNGEDSWTQEVPISTPSNPVSRVFHDVGGFLGFAPSGEKDFIKRVIGVPGDHVVCCDAQGRIKVNNVPLDESYLSSGVPTPTATTTQVNASIPFDIIVPPNRVWVEGDHRDDSADSRSHRGDGGGGTIPESKIIGRAFVVVWPVSHWRGLSVPHSFRAVADAGVGGSPMGIGIAAVAPLAFVRLRKRHRSGRRGRHARDTRPSAGSKATVSS
jgi:signal peptidase I